MNLQDQVVIITGASSGIGEACAKAFSKAGSKVVIAARRGDRLNALAQSLAPAQCLVVTADISQPAAVEALVAQTIERFGRVDILVNNAGAGCVGRIADLDLQLARQVFDTNFFGAVQCIQAVVPHMRKQGGGHIINVSSIIGKRSIPDIGFYCATKFAMNAMSDALRLELKPQKIYVTTICPGLTETEFPQASIRPEKVKAIKAKMPGQSAAHVAKVIVKAARTRPREVHLTASGNFLVGMERLSPSTVDILVGLRRVVYK